MKKEQKIILVLAVVAYGVMLYSFLTQNLWVLLVSIIISSALLVCFNLVASDDDSDETADVELKDAMERNLALLKEKEELENELRSKDAMVENAKADALKAEQEKDALSKEHEEELRRQVSEAVAKAKEEAISQAGVTGGATYEGLLPQTEQEENETSIIDIVELCRQTAAEFDSFAAKAEVAIKVSTTEDKLLVKADSARIRIMFRNIIDNAIKYMNKAGSLIITLSSIGDDIFVVLKDNGNGLSPDETKHIFELNFQGSNRISGNGLGLTQAKAIVDYYGGTIYAKSTEGNGMGIYIQIPSKSVED